MFADAFDRVPVGTFFLFVALITLFLIYAGERLGRRRRELGDHEPEGPVAGVVGATLALLGFMVALTLESAQERFDARKDAFIDGVNAIESAYRVASLLPDPENGQVRALLRRYIAVRLELLALFHDPQRFETADARIRQMHQELWTHAQTLGRADRNSEIYALFASSLLDVFRIYNKRVILIAQFHIPMMVWAALLVVTIASMFGVGFHFGLVGRRILISALVLALAYASVMTIIFDLDRPARGGIAVNPRPMYDLQQRLLADRQ